MRELAATGIDMDTVGSTLEEQGVAGFHESCLKVHASLSEKAGQLSRG
ncbi:hypothetical protein [Micromonospora sp. CPCC 206061]